MKKTIENIETSPNEKEKKKDKTVKGYKNLWSMRKFIGPYKWPFIYVALMSLGASAFGVLMPMLSARMVNAISIFNESSLFWTALFLLCAELLQEALYFLSWGLVFQKVTQSIGYDMFHKMTEKVVQLKTKNFDKANSGVFIQTINNDMGTVVRTFTQLTDIITLIFAKLGFLAYVFTLNVWLALFIIAQMIIVYIVKHFRIKYNFKRNKVTKQKQDKKVATTGEIVRGVRDVKSLNLEEGLVKKADEIQADMKAYIIKTEKTQYLFRSGSSWLNALLDFSFIVFAIFLIKIGNLSPVEALTMYMFKGNVTNLFGWIIQIKEMLKDAELSAERVNKLLNGFDFGYEEFGSEILDTTSPKEIEFKDVEFSYDEGKEVLHKASFKIKPNTTVGIVGESGEGKSTIIKLIAKLYDINGGKILINGKELTTLDKNSIRNNISIVPQDPYIFNFSFKENLKLVNPDASDEEIIDACKKAQLHDFIVQQKDGYDTVLGENGIVLSGGQKQRLAIARALLRSTPILLFDEATSSLDNENQAKIKEVIANLGGAKTVVIVAHRLSTIQDADNILFIKNGKLHAEGKHTKLMKTCEEYKNLYKSEN